MRVLIADDCPTTRRVLAKNMVEWGFQPVVARDGAEALRVLQAKFAPRLAILDWMMPYVDGPTVCRKMRENTAAPYVYVIILTAKAEHDDLVAAFDAAADDFLTKPFNTEELRQRLRAGQRILDLQDRLLATQQKLLFQATHDALTGVWNRRAVIDCLQRELNRAQRHSSASNCTSLIMADLDNFKRVNDVHGHLVGDAVLRDVTSRMQNVLRSYDTLGRFGGEEFIVILPETDSDEAERIAERLRADVGREPIVQDDKSVQVTTSLGVATMLEADLDEKMLIRAADQALYRAKEEGRNRVEIATEADFADRCAIADPAGV
jgi:diguanylate cyclase (GGDEF)-like protein